MNADESQFGGGEGEEAPPAEQLPSPPPDPEAAPGPDGPGERPPATSGAAGGFTSGEKIRSLLEVAFTTRPPDPNTRAALNALRVAQRFRLLRPVLDVFPRLEDTQAWDDWLALAVGVFLNLLSDGVAYDVGELHAAGGQVLAQLFADAEGAPPAPGL